MSEDQNFTPFIMDGAEGFSSCVKVHHRMMEVATPYVMDALDKTFVSPGETFVLGDYGTADGGTSYKVIEKAIAFLRKKHGDDLPIQVVYEDQPINNFTHVFLRASGFTLKFPNVFVLASGTTFYSQCLPANSTNFIFNACAIHWLSKGPEIPSNGLFPTLTQGPANDACRKQSEEDWENFLLMRAKELKPGGCLIVTSIDCSDDSRLEISTKDVFSDLTVLWRGMFEDGLISKREFEYTHVALHCRYPDELEKPFKCKSSRVSRTGLSLTAMMTEYILCPHREHWRRLTATQADKNMALKHVKSVVVGIRSWIERQLWAGLDDQRPADEKQAILDTYFDRYFAFIKDDPRRSMDYLLAILVIRKEGNLKEDNQ